MTRKKTLFLSRGFRSRHARWTKRKRDCSYSTRTVQANTLIKQVLNSADVWCGLTMNCLFQNKNCYTNQHQIYCYHLASFGLSIYLITLLWANTLYMHRSHKLAKFEDVMSRERFGTLSSLRGRLGKGGLCYN